MWAKVPGSTSNLGPGFDVLGLALSRYCRVEVIESERLELVAHGEGAGLRADGDHLAVRVVREVLGHDRVQIRIDSEIPLGRGLGSSAALAVATAAAAGAPDPFAIGARFDGHAENAAASFFGGLVAANLVEDRPVARRLPLDERLSFVVVVPERELQTKTARSVLPAQVAFADATFNLGRLGLLLAGLGDVEQLLAAAGEDRLHQAQRSSLFPEAPAILDALSSAGALVACWSGAGPSMIGICRSGAATEQVRRAGDEALASLGLAGSTVVLEADRVGLVTGSS
jgi:homoserine kinase